MATGRHKCTFCRPGRMLCMPAALHARVGARSLPGLVETFVPGTDGDLIVIAAAAAQGVIAMTGHCVVRQGQLRALSVYRRGRGPAPAGGWGTAEPGAG